MIILNYHELSDCPLRGPSQWSFSPAQFKYQLSFYQQQLISPEKFLLNCNIETNAKSSDIVLTFDDGFVSDYRCAFPLLIENLSVGFISFICPCNIGVEGYLNWQMLKEMSTKGVCFGSHAYSHRPLTTQNMFQVEEQLRRSKYEIEDKIGKEIFLLAFPFGKFNKMVCDTALKLGYTHMFTIDRGYHNAFKPSLYSRLCVSNLFSDAFLRRYVTNPNDDRSIAYKLSSKLGLYKPIKDIIYRLPY